MGDVMEQHWIRGLAEQHANRVAVRLKATRRQVVAKHGRINRLIDSVGTWAFPEQRLWGAVLKQAVSDLEMDNRHIKVNGSAAVFFRNKKRFTRVCGIVGISPYKMRRWIRQEGILI